MGKERDRGASSLRSPGRLAVVSASVGTRGVRVQTCHDNFLGVDYHTKAHRLWSASTKEGKLQDAAVWRMERVWAFTLLEANWSVWQCHCWQKKASGSETRNFTTQHRDLCEHQRMFIRFSWPPSPTGATWMDPDKTLTHTGVCILGEKPWTQGTLIFYSGH